MTQFAVFKTHTQHLRHALSGQSIGIVPTFFFLKN